MKWEEMDWGVVLLILIVMMVFLYLGSGCTSKVADRPTLHNYPHMDDCPWTEGKFDQAWVIKASKKLGMRPVDFLHSMVSKKFTKEQLTELEKDYVVFKNNK